MVSDILFLSEKIKAIEEQMAHLTYKLEEFEKELFVEEGEEQPQNDDTKLVPKVRD